MTKKRPLKKILFAVTVVVMLTVIITATAFAADTGVTLTGGTELVGGAITFADFANVTLTGHQTNSFATWTIGDVTDPRGTGAGWELSLRLTPLKEYSGTDYVVSGHTIPANSITVSVAPTVTEADGTSSAASAIGIVTTGTALDSGDFVPLLTAGANEGMGSYAIGDMTAELTIRADAYAGTYKTDATVQLVTAP